MDTLITCPKCKTEIPLSDAFKHEIETGVLATERARHARELEAAIKAAETTATKKASDDAAQREASLRAEAAEEKERNRKLLGQLEEMTTELRALRRKDEERDLAYKQQLAADEERIRAEAHKKAEAEYQLQLQDGSQIVELTASRRRNSSLGLPQGTPRRLLYLISLNPHAERRPHVCWMGILIRHTAQQPSSEYTRLSRGYRRCVSD